MNPMTNQVYNYAGKRKEKKKKKSTQLYLKKKVNNCTNKIKGYYYYYYFFFMKADRNSSRYTKDANNKYTAIIFIPTEKLKWSLQHGDRRIQP